jgi:RHS repeat-associated protein
LVFPGYFALGRFLKPIPPSQRKNVNSYIYDAEGRICAVKSEPVPGTYSMTAYVYDADGNRVAKGALSSWPTDGLCPNLAPGGVFTPTNSYVLGPSGEQLTETDGNGNWIHSNVFAAGMLISTYDMAPTGAPAVNAPAVHFQLEDWLGSRRVQTDIAGNQEETFSNLPFGDGLIANPVSGAPPTADDATEHHFTGKERDQESGNDYFGARYYASTMGRFLSPDWSAKEEPVPYAKLDNPQSAGRSGSGWAPGRFYYHAGRAGTISVPNQRAAHAAGLQQDGEPAGELLCSPAWNSQERHYAPDRVNQVPLQQFRQLQQQPGSGDTECHTGSGDLNGANYKHQSLCRTCLVASDGCRP